MEAMIMTIDIIIVTVVIEETVMIIDTTKAVGAEIVTTDVTGAVPTAGVHRGEAKGKTTTERRVAEAAVGVERTTEKTGVHRPHRRAHLCRARHPPVHIRDRLLPLRTLQSRRTRRPLTRQGHRDLRTHRGLRLLPHRKEKSLE